MNISSCYHLIFMKESVPAFRDEDWWWWVVELTNVFFFFGDDISVTWHHNRFFSTEEEEWMFKDACYVDVPPRIIVHKV